MIDNPQDNQNKNTDDPQDDEEDTTYSEKEDTEKHAKSKPPSVKGEEDIFSGDTPVSGEDYDIDEERQKVGLGDGKPLDLEEELNEEES